MKVKFLKAGTGDCILINHDSKNILIDSGNESAFLKSEYHEIKSRGEKINFLIITHHDDDHIKGILDLFKEFEITDDKQPLIDHIIFNSPRKILNKIEAKNDSNTLSYKQAYELEEYLLKHPNIKWMTTINTDVETILNNLFEQNNIEIKLFTPNQDSLLNYASDKGAYLTSDHRCDWNVPLAILNKNIDDKSQDISLSNQTSIVLLIKYNSKNLLFTGDITPDRLNEIIDELKEKNETIDFDLIKLPHHSSYRSLNSSLLKKIKCLNFVISTNSNKHYLPNKRAILKILNHRLNNEKVNFLFNYGEVINKLNITKSELNQFNFELKTNNENCGYVINI